jgi:DNA-binding response OmpR family regulator
MLTAKAEELDKVRGLDVGADDDLGRPFGPPELLARVRAVLRRVPRGVALPAQSVPRFSVGDLAIDFSQHLVKRRGQPVDLSPTEYRLLAHLAHHAGTVVVSDALLNAVWGPEYRDELQHVRLYISRVSRKIEDDPEHPRYVLTRPGIGYMLVNDVEEIAGASR